jgi:hypothetical protein
LAKTGDTDAAAKLLQQLSYSNDPDVSYLKGII